MQGGQDIQTETDWAWQTLGAAPPPDLDQVALAVVLAAIEMRELCRLVIADEPCLRGTIKFRARWVAFAALLSTSPGVPPFALGHLLGCGRVPLFLLEQQRRQAWWDERRVVTVVTRLLSASGAQAAVREGLRRQAHQVRNALEAIG